MHNVDQFFHGSHYNIIRILLSGSGLWPFTTIVSRYMIYLAMILVIGSGFIFQLMGVMEVWQDTVELVDSLPFLILDIACMCKMICLVYKLPKIKLLLLKIQEYCLSPKSNEEYEIHNSHAVYGRNFSYLYTSVAFSHCGAFVIMSALTKLTYTKPDENSTSLDKVHGVPPGLPCRVNYIVDIDTYYVPIFIHAVTSQVSFAILIVIIDVLYLTLIEHCCGLFAALRYRMENAFESENKNDNGLIKTEDDSYSNIVYSMRRHAEVIQFVAILDSVYSIPLFIHVSCTIFDLSALGLQVITNVENMKFSDLLKQITSLSISTITIFFENWQGQKIINSSEKVFEAAYNAKWYNMSVAARKLLVMVMMKSIKPSIVSAGNKFIVLSYVTFNATMRMSMSYFMLFRSIK